MLRLTSKRLCNHHSWNYSTRFSRRHSRTYSGVSYEEDRKQKLKGTPHLDVLKNSNVVTSKAPTKIEDEESSHSFVQHLVQYVEKTTYMDEVRKSQANVMDIKKKLMAAGEEKRTLMKYLEDIRNELSHIYKDMKINRSKELYEVYLDLTRQEIKLCELEKEYSDRYKHIDKEEQQLFTEFSTAINDSYEKEKLHTNFIKVISIIGTVASSFIALILSLLYHAFQYKRISSIKPYDDEMLKAIHTKLRAMEDALSKGTENRESWGSYLHRHTKWVYSWAVKSK